MELSPEERQRIYLEEKARHEAYRQLHAQSKKTSIGEIAGFIVLGGFGLLVLLFVAGSVIMNADKTSTRPALVAISESTGNPAHDRLMGLGVGEQAAVLGQIAGERCGGESAFFMGTDKNTNAYWSVRCTNGRSYQVQIQPNATGNTSIMDCDVLKAVAKVSCFERLDQQ